MAERRYRVGLTGGIGSGKSTVAAEFASLGVPVVDADLLAREVVLPGTPAWQAILERFGSALAGPDGTLDRRRLRAIVFADEAARRDLEAIVHPRVWAALLERVDAAPGPAPYGILVVPLLLESGGAERVHRILVVDCEEAQQRERASRRDGVTGAEVEAIMASQVPRETRLRHADDVLYNGGARADLKPAVAELHARYKELAAQRLAAS